MGLTHPTDLADWHRWSARRRPWPARVKGLAHAALGRVEAGVLTTGSSRPRVLIALDAVKSTTVAAQLAPLAHLEVADVAVLAPTSVRHLLPVRDWVETPGAPADLARSVVTPGTVVLSTGHHLGIGAAARAALPDATRFLTVQHGLLTPHAPPLAERTTLLAWSDADGAFWRSGRDDLTVRTVGSQLLWEAGRAAGGPRADADTGSAPVYLGQLHGAELPRPVLESAAHDFCIAHHGRYRPHPSETDRASVTRHRAWEAEGIPIDRGGGALADLVAPVVSVYSTGVLEAAASGLPAWVDLPEPPAWLEEFWRRNGMHRWGSSPTPAPLRPADPPAAAVARVLLEMLGETP